MYKIPISNIVEITQDKIYYRDDRGDVVFIELETCANNYESRHKSMNQSEHKFRCVGNRFFGEYAYYELYTIGHMQFYINLRTNSVKKMISKIFGLDFYDKDFRQFYFIQKQLNANGWTTLDLS